MGEAEGVVSYGFVVEMPTGPLEEAQGCTVTVNRPSELLILVFDLAGMLYVPEALHLRGTAIDNLLVEH